MTMTDEQSLAEKVAALLNKAESSEFDAERDAFTEKAMELMRRHSLAQAVVDAARGKDGPRPDEPIIREFLPLDGIYHHAWSSLGVVIARSHDCEVVKHHATYDHKNGRLAIIGTQSNVMAVELLFTSLMIQANRAMQTYWTNECGKAGVKYSGSTGFKIRREFLLGFVSGVSPLLAEAKKTATETFVAETEGVTSESLGLALRDDKARVKEWVGETYGRLGRGRGGQLAGGGMGSNAAGRRAGGMADTGRAGMTGARGAIGR